MMYGYMTLDDGTEIVHSDMKDDGTVKVYIEKPVHVHIAEGTPQKNATKLWNEKCWCKNCNNHLVLYSWRENICY